MLAAFCLLWAADAQAQGLTRRGQLSREDLYNPQPIAAEILLPMPCGLKMSLAPVAVRVNGLLWDTETRFGCTNCGREDMGYYERQYVGHISAPFTASDLPEAWRDLLPQSAMPQQYYFIGRYEVSVAQWEAIMNRVCLPPGPEAARPKVFISWYEALAFTERYMEWLVEEIPGTLPGFYGDSKNIGVLRLPTEQEWEYAARGGHMVSANSMLVDPFFPIEQNASHSDYAVFRDGTSSASAEPERIGTRLPNPLGLHDVAGNAAEMTMDSFKFSLGGRLHGSAGGFVRKGGSFLTGIAEIMPGRREEAALFFRDGPARAVDLGFRLALSGINTPAGPRSQELQAEWAALGQNSGLLHLDEAEDPLAVLALLLQNARTAEQIEAFERLRVALKDANIAQERLNADMAVTHVRAAVHVIFTLRNLEQRRVLTTAQIAMLQEDMQAMEPELRELYEAPFRERLENWHVVLESIDVAMQDQFTNYRALLEKSLAFNDILLDAALLAAEGEAGAVGSGTGSPESGLDSSGLYAAELRRCVAQFEVQLELLRNGQAASVTLESLVREGF